MKYNLTFPLNNGYFTYYDTHTWKFFIPGIRGEYHIGKYLRKELDLYGGGMIGYNYVVYYSSSSTGNPYQSKILYDVPSYEGLIWSGFIGARYDLNNHFGAFCELGYGINLVNLGFNYFFGK